MSITQIPHPEHKFLIYEQNAPRDATARAAVGNPNGGGVLFLLTTRHLARCNVGFADGHVEPVEAQSVLPQTDPNSAHVELGYEDLTYNGY